jgi:hypothetical protein
MFMHSCAFRREMWMTERYHARAAAVRLIAAAFFAGGGFADAAPSSSTSTAAPDVIGIKVGGANVPDVRAALAKVTPPLFVEETEGRLLGQSTKGRGVPSAVEIPNGKYVARLRGTTLAFQDTLKRCNTDNIDRLGKGNCETIDVSFSEPPNAGTVLHVQREIAFAEAPSLDNTVQSLIAKYGQPGYSENYHGYGTQYDYAWAWNTSGAPVPLDARHPCAALDMATLKELQYRGDDNAAALRAGCAAVVHAKLNVKNGVVKFLTVNAVDHFRSNATTLKTREFISGGVAQSEQGERAKAATVAAPKL